MYGAESVFKKYGLFTLLSQEVDIIVTIYLATQSQM